MAEIKEFERFDVVSDDSDHYFRQPPRNKKKIKKQKKMLDQNPSSSSNALAIKTECAVPDCFTNAGSEVYKKIMKEWRILAQNLPESIYVRVYEKRIDLLRAVIVGAAGTPYHDGLFFFDIAFPPDYPTRPPNVHYRSHGFKLNPNLYMNGYVCLSLLNTWVGNKAERWSSSDSTILQLLVSIQGLVLNEKPFFNEAGSEIFGRALFEKKALAYNDNVFALSCRTMMCLLQRPPRNFESFVLGHFRERARAILVACNDYVNGRVRVGYYYYSGDDDDDVSCSSSSSTTMKVSEKFKDSMRMLYPQLVAAFRCSGASLESSVQHLKMEKKGSSKNIGHVTVIIRKAIGKINKFYASASKTRSRKNETNVIQGEAVTHNSAFCP